MQDLKFSSILLSCLMLSHSLFLDTVQYNFRCSLNEYPVKTDLIFALLE